MAVYEIINGSSHQRCIEFRHATIKQRRILKVSKGPRFKSTSVLQHCVESVQIRTRKTPYWDTFDAVQVDSDGVFSKANECPKVMCFIVVTFGLKTEEKIGSHTGLQNLHRVIVTCA